MADPKNTSMQEDGKSQGLSCSMPDSSSVNPCEPNSACFSYPPNHHTEFSSKYLSGQSPHDLASSKYTDSDLYELIIEKIEKDRLYVQSQITYLETLLSDENKSIHLDGMNFLMEQIDAVENDIRYLGAEYRTAQKEFKNGLKSLKLLKNVKDFVEYLKESRRVFHSKKKVFKSQLLELKRLGSEDRSRLGNLLSGVWRFIACNR